MTVSAPVSSSAAGEGSSHRDAAPSFGLGQPVTPDCTYFCLDKVEIRGGSAQVSRHATRLCWLRALFKSTAARRYVKGVRGPDYSPGRLRWKRQLFKTDTATYCARFNKASQATVVVDNVVFKLYDRGGKLILYGLQVFLVGGSCSLKQTGEFGNFIRQGLTNAIAKGLDPASSWIRWALKLVVVCFFFFRRNSKNAHRHSETFIKKQFDQR